MMDTWKTLQWNRKVDIVANYLEIDSVLGGRKPKIIMP